MLRVVDNLVYFSVKADTTTNQSTSTTVYTTTANTVPIGFTMSVTPQINESDTVQLNLRPSITRLLGYVNDPNPSLSAAGVVSRIPQTQSREMESMLSIENNQIAVLGGLMQNDINNQSDTVPFLASLPLIGGLFKSRNDNSNKTELVIFIKPTVIKEAGLDGDYVAYRSRLPGKDFVKAE
jgi:general secretion pathway protein D